MSDLRDQLIAAQLSTEAFRADDGYMSLGVRGNEEAADVALAVVEPLLAAAEVRGYNAAVAAVQEFAAAHTADGHDSLAAVVLRRTASRLDAVRSERLGTVDGGA